MKQTVIAITLLLLVSAAHSETYYIRVDGGSAAECTGLTDAAYPGTGTGQDCAWDHPFRALPPGGSAVISGGDTIIIGSGSYRMGYGADAGETCSSSWPWDCYMTAVPSGTEGNPTRILGQGWDTLTGTKPELWGAERASRIVNLSDSDYVELQYLDITDHETCVDNSNNADNACNRSAYPYGDWAKEGIYADDSVSVTLKNMEIHGLTNGIHAARLTDWTVENVTIRGNGMAGWDGDIYSGDGSDSNSGAMTFTGGSIEWNGCIETYPGETITGCWGQVSGGYGDGLGVGATAGDWTFTGTQFMHNTSDGLDLLYHDGSGTITIDRVRAEGNAGNQLKTATSTTIKNTVVVGNCGFFDGSEYETGTEFVDDCRALGNAIALKYRPGQSVSIVNTSVYSEGDTLILATGTTCDGTESLIVRNSVFEGDTDFLQTFENSGWFYNDGCGSLTPDADYNIIYNVKADPCPYGSNDICDAPLLGPFAGENIDMVPGAGSPAINPVSLDVGATVAATTVPSVDYLGNARPYGASVDFGAYEVGASPPVQSSTARALYSPTARARYGSGVMRQ